MILGFQGLSKYGDILGKNILKTYFIGVFIADFVQSLSCDLKPNPVQIYCYILTGVNLVLGVELTCELLGFLVVNCEPNWYLSDNSIRTILLCCKFCQLLISF